MSYPKQKQALQNSAPLNACFFNDTSVVTFEEKAEAEDNKFKIVAYTGRVIEGHWYWGNVAFDLEGISFDKNKTPVLDYHSFGNRIGFTTRQEITDKVAVEGKFLNNEKAQELRNDMKDGFPMQASVYIPPTVIEYVKEGENIKVNGHTLKGPGAVFRKAKIKDVTICTFGYDSHTRSEAFAEGNKKEVQFNIIERNTKMDEDTKSKLTAETFAADCPELFGEITAKAKAEGEKEGEKNVTERFEKFVEKFGNDPAFCIEQFKAGNSLEAAVAAQNEKLKKTNAELTEKAKEQARPQVDPAKQEFSDEQKQGDEEEVAQTPKGKYTAEFNKSTDIQAEFAGAEGLADYIAFRTAEDKGLVSVKSNR